MTYKYQWDEYTFPRTLSGESKYRRRMNFHGLTLKGVLTVSCCVYIVCKLQPHCNYKSYILRSQKFRLIIHCKKIWTAQTLHTWTA